jgi:uncharacterized coiled-coil protein SlyX/mRNA-degrading endonuclease toxin of MazEF toxin-antitoxin module
VAAHLRSKAELATRVVEELENIKGELDPVIVTGDEVPQPDQFTYEGHAATDAVIPEDPKDVTRAHGASIMRISPRHSAGLAELHVRILLNCYCSETNSVRVAVFEDSNEHPVVVLTENLIAAELTLVDQDVFISVSDGSRPLLLEIRVGLAHSGGILSLNHVPALALASAVRFRWLPIETASERLAERERITVERDYLVAKRDERRAEQERFLAERDRIIAEYKRLLVERDETIAEHGRLLAKRDRRIAEHEHRVAEQDGIIAEHKHFLAERDGVITEQKRLLVELDAALVAIQDSRSWRLTAPFRGAMNWLRR